MTQEIVIGIDGGGTSTRVMAADLTGNILGYVESGTARLDKHQDALQNVQGAIADVVLASQRTFADVACIVAGIAGLNCENDKAWARSLTQLPGVECRRRHVNDAVIAHAGALQSNPGIIVISGTGSVVYGVTDARRHIRNYDMQHYANSGARHIAYAAIFQILAGENTPADEPLIAQVLDHWQVPTLDMLRDMLTYENTGAHEVDWAHVGQLAPIITEAAMKGVPIAKRACDRAADELSVGIRLIGSHFGTASVDVAFIGSVIRSRYMRLATGARLQIQSANKSYHVVESVFSSQVGAVLLALEELDIPLTENVMTNIRRHPKSILLDE
ncbi:BadF/BadG/BcrA/BcrD ATPase family protein [Alicyclobacillus fodiniaquatilis]|uniref:BadF/BadG/BcrA/BcrD ATPase family protein n=1 Tax=Alicyclobacillus fodiniaquatilis TaxID=1661150 RepID=A0ABW4JDK4_9BACL